MRRITALLVALFMLLACSASAEPVNVPVYSEDTTTDVPMNVFESELRYSIAYDPAYFTASLDSDDYIELNGYTGAGISFQSITDMSLQEIEDGIVLQSGTDDAAVDEAYMGGTFSDAITVPAVIYSEDVDGEEFVHSFFFIERSDDVLMMECFYPLDVDLEFGASFDAMMQTFQLL